MCPDLSSRPARGRNAMPLALAFLAAAGGLVGHATAGPVADAFPAFRLDVASADLLPRVAEEATLLSLCQAPGRCVRGPFPASSEVAFGLLPTYSGAVTLSVRVGSVERPALTCQVPGTCPLVATGGVPSPFWVVGQAAPGTAGAYAVWVSHG